jgi:hypothetical protein
MATAIENLFCVSGTSPTSFRGAQLLAPIPFSPTSFNGQTPGIPNTTAIRDTYFALRLLRQTQSLAMPSPQPSAGGLLYKIGLARTQRRIKRDATKPYVFINGDNNLQSHRDGCCYCPKCVDKRNASTTQSSFRDDMLRRGFTDVDGSLGQYIGTDFYNDIVFLINRINTLPPNSRFDQIWSPVEEPILSLVPPMPETWTPPKIQIEYVIGKRTITNIRCMVCGAVDKQRYPKTSLLGSSKKVVCDVSSEYLCDRESCVRSRGVKQDFDVLRLHTGYNLHPHFAPPVYKSLLLWVRSQARNDSDPNLKCDLRYDRDTRGRKGIKSRIDYGDTISAVANPSPVHTADTSGSFSPLKGMTDRNRLDSSEVRYFENDFAARIKGVVASRPVIPVTVVWFDPSIHKLVGQTFEEKRRIPNYNCFGADKKVSKDEPIDKTDKTVEKLVSDLEPNANFDSVETRDVGVTKTGIWSGDTLRWTPGQGLAYPLIPLTPASRLEELAWREKVKVPFDGTTVFKTLKETSGAADEIRRNQIEKLKALKSNVHVPPFIEDIILRGKRMKLVAKEQKKSVPAIKQKVYRDLNKPVATEDSIWAKAIKSSDRYQDGVYAAATIGGQTRAYLILSATQFVDTSAEDNMAMIEDGLHNVICDILERRIKKGRVEEDSDVRPLYRGVYDAFNRFGWRMLRDGVWYQEDQTEAPVLSLT